MRILWQLQACSTQSIEVLGQAQARHPADRISLPLRGLDLGAVG